MATAVDQWLREHGAGERRLAKVFDRYFTDQTARLAKALGRLRSPSADDLADVFDADAEHARLMELLPVPLAGLAAAGAIRVLEQAKQRRRRRTRKDAADDAEDFETAVAEGLEDFEIPENVREAIQTSLGELIEEPYWQDIQSTTSESLAKILTDAVEEGLNGSQLAKRINQALGGQQKVRAKLIARTESTMMFNSGHSAVISELAADGLVDGKQWMSIIDDWTRKAHVTLNGKVVDADADFDVGGSKAPYPGHYRLPAKQRIGCRCVVISKFKDE
jgi:SPP1 gp7 family putative phage head morphogenesis protein